MRAYYGSRISEHMTETPEGYLICLGVPIARIGSQKYLTSELGINDSEPDKMVRVERMEDEVFAQATIASFEGKPVTDDHPSESVNPQNIAAYDCGHIQNVRRGTGADSDLLIADLFITNQNLIDAIKNGKREVSCGYDCEYAQDTDGKIYQRAIRGNHVAVVDSGRAGHRVAIKDASPRNNSHNERGNVRMANTKENSLFARLFSRAVRDMEPQEIEDAIEEMAATAAGEVPADSEPMGMGATPAEMPQTDEDPMMSQILMALNRLTEKVEALEAAGMKTDAEPVDPMKELEDELNAPEMGAPIENEGDVPTDEDPEASMTVPAEEIETDEEVELGGEEEMEMPMDCEAPVAAQNTLPKNPIAGADKAAALYALNAIKPVIAALPSYQRKAASDKAVAEIRKLMGKTARARSNGYVGISNVMSQTAKGKKTADAAAKDNGKIGEDIMKSRNPHYKNK